MDEQPTVEIPDLDNLPEERVPVVILVHNGLVTEDGPMFVPAQYAIPITVLQQVQHFIADYELIGGF